MFQLRMICFLLMISVIFDRRAMSSKFVRVKGNVIRKDNGERFPRGGVIMKCVGKCQFTEGCACVRISTDGSDTCDVFTSKTEANGLNSTGFMYFAIDRSDSMSKQSVAFKKPSVQSSIYNLNGVQYTADRAVDGSKNVEAFEAPYISQTNEQPSDAFPWWAVDLRSDHIITGVTVLNRRKYADRLHDFEIRVGNSPLTNAYNGAHFVKNPLCSEHTGGGIGDGESRTFICEPCPVQGKYISIQIVRKCNNCTQPNNNILSLAEVEVHGFAVNE